MAVVDPAVRMSFPKAPLKRFNDPSGAYGCRSRVGRGRALDPSSLSRPGARLRAGMVFVFLKIHAVNTQQVRSRMVGTCLRVK